MSQDTPPLDAALARLAAEGWRIQFRAPASAQLVKPKRFRRADAAVLAVACVALAILGGVVGILLALLLLTGVSIWQAGRQDDDDLGNGGSHDAEVGIH